MASTISPRLRVKKPAAPETSASVSIRTVAQFRERQFDIKTLPNDMQRVYKALAGKYGEEYALVVIFTMRTAIELHRAWHMTLLTNKILQQLKDRFRLRMTWDLGVFRLNFRLEDGGKELHRYVGSMSNAEVVYHKATYALFLTHLLFPLLRTARFRMTMTARTKTFTCASPLP